MTVPRMLGKQFNKERRGGEKGVGKGFLREKKGKSKVSLGSNHHDRPVTKIRIFAVAQNGAGRGTVGISTLSKIPKERRGLNRSRSVHHRHVRSNHKDITDVSTTPQKKSQENHLTNHPTQTNQRDHKNELRLLRNQREEESFLPFRSVEDAF